MESYTVVLRYNTNENTVISQLYNLQNYNFMEKY